MVRKTNWRNFVAVMTTSAFVFLVAALPACAQDWEIVPGRSVGPIKEDTSEKELIKIFGSRNVRRMAIDVGEDETAPGTVVFPNDSRKRVFIRWRDATTREGPESVTIRGKSTFWKTDRGITIGTTLRTIEKLNGRPFALTGFAWDYSGTVLSSNGGQLAELGVEGPDGGLVGRTLLLRLEPAAALQRSRGYQAMAGDKKFFSDNPAMQKLNPSVYEMILVFAP